MALVYEYENKKENTALQLHFVYDDILVYAICDFDVIEAILSDITFRKLIYPLIHRSVTHRDARELYSAHGNIKIKWSRYNNRLWIVKRQQ